MQCPQALLGALYLDAGFAAARAFTLRVLDACVDWRRLEDEAADYKGLLRWAASLCML